MKSKYLDIKLLLILLILLIVLFILKPHWFSWSSFSATDKKKQEAKNYNVLQLIAPEIPKAILEKNIIIAENLQPDFDKNNNNKKIPEILVIYLRSFNILAEAEKFCLGLSNKNMPYFIQVVHKKNNKSIFSYINKEEYGVFIGPEVDIDVINSYMKEIKLLGLTGSITSYNI